MIYQWKRGITLISLVFMMSGFNKNQDTYPRPENIEKLETQFGEKLPLKTNIILTVSSLSSQLNESMTFEAMIRPSFKISSKPKGTVTFTENGKTVCKNVPIDSASFRASCLYKNNAIGAHTLVATYSGDDSVYEPSKSTMVYYVIKLASKTELNVTPNKANFAQNDVITLNAKISSLDATIPANGTVSFYVNTQPITNCMQKQITSAACEYTVQKNDGTLEFTAKYSGDANHDTSGDYKTLNKTNGLQISWIAQNPILSGKTPSASSAQFLYTPQTSKQGLTFRVKIAGMLNDKNIVDYKNDVNFGINAITPLNNYLLERSAQSVNNQEFKNVICSMAAQNDGSLIATCNGFRPTALNFNLTTLLTIKSFGIVASKTFSASVKSNNITATKISNNIAPATGCGLNGTTRQRMFDCSMYVSNFGGHVDARQNFIPYTVGSTAIEAEWFLVNCPQGQSVPQSCSWLSPILHDNNPALASGQFDTNGIAMSQYKENRLLWSGVAPKTFTFFQANGGQSNNTKIFKYTEYPLIDETIMAKNSGSTKSVTQSICQTGKNLGLFSTNSSYHWQMPSYPMIMTLTGPSYCDVGGIGYSQDWKSFCNGGATPRGYRATLVPGFIKNYLWSSSLDPVNNVAWIFNGTDGGVDVDVLDNNNYVRCVSASW